MFDDDMFELSVSDLQETKKIDHAFKNLINYSLQIYDLMMGKMYDLEKSRLQNKTEYKRCLNKIKILTTKEQRVIDKLLEKIDIEDFENNIDGLLAEYVDASAKKEAIKTRISYFFDTNDITRDHTLDGETKEEYYRCFEFVTDINLDFIKKSYTKSKKRPDLLKHKYYMGFINPNVGTCLLYAGFNPNNVVSLPYSAPCFSNFSPEELKEEKLEFYYEYVNDLITKLLLDSNDQNFDKTTINSRLDFINFIIKKLSTADLIITKKELESSQGSVETIVLYKDVTVLDKLLLLISKQLSKRHNYNEEQTIEQIQFGDSEIDENELVETISEGLINQIFNLIKQVSKTYDLAMKMCLLESQDKQNTIKYKELLNDLKDSVLKEKKISQEIEIASSEMDVITDIINNCINLIAEVPDEKTDIEYLCNTDNNSGRNYIIARRISDLVGLYYLDDSIYKHDNEPSIILQSHLIEVLKVLDEAIKENDNKLPLINVKYEALIFNIDLTDCFIEAEGKIENMILLDDNLLAALLEIELDEYEFDKSELLYNYISLIVDEFLENEQLEIDEIENARLVFKGMFIELASKYIQDGKVEIISEDELSDEHQKTFNQIKSPYQRRR